MGLFSLAQGFNDEGLNGLLPVLGDSCRASKGEGKGEGDGGGAEGAKDLESVPGK